MNMKKDLSQPQFSHKFKICISGAAETGHCAADAMDKALELGREVIRQKGILVNGATTGFPLWAARGAKEEGGIVVGVSPASSEKEHVEKYDLPLEHTDMIIYTGFGYSGRNLLLTRSADAVIIGCSRMGTLNEFTIAFEDDKPIGVLTGVGPAEELIKAMVEKSYRGPGKIVYDVDPKTLVSKVIELIRKEKNLKTKDYL